MTVHREIWVGRWDGARGKQNVKLDHVKLDTGFGHLSGAIGRF